MSASDIKTQERDIVRMRYKALRQLRKKDVSKRVLSKIANSTGLPSEVMDSALEGLISEGCVVTYTPDNYNKRGPNPKMHRITDLGRDELKELAKAS